MNKADLRIYRTEQTFDVLTCGYATPPEVTHRMKNASFVHAGAVRPAGQAAGQVGTAARTPKAPQQRGARGPSQTLHL